ncbi:energy-coupling factor transporter transmembrane component T [Bacillus sp. FJAT-28004]|uniref:energy-coupling factor transporter transmembrane component T n=1 Tax=Bacillus sp. FJAT-28004 TaxID=1679165 RepID=UPI0006B4381C|nr:energy-coupling factor transporter transmembrane component T [Bacillus sp. FJAT-28004]
MNSAFGSVHPVTSFSYYAGVISFSMLLFHPAFLVTSLVAITVIIVIHGEGKRLLKLLPYYILMGGLVAILNPLFSHRGRHILFYFMDQPITLEAILYGVTMMLSLLCILLAFVSFQQIVTTEKWMYLFSRVAPRTALLTSMSIRFVPLFLRRLDQITTIQRTKGVSIREGSLRKRSRDGMLLVRVLLTWSLEEALQTADSMKARGYGAAKRSSYVIYRMDRRDWYVLMFLGAMALVCIWGWMQGFGVLVIYPRLETLQFHPGEGIAFAGYCAFLLTPVALEEMERRSWK